MSYIRREFYTNNKELQNCFDKLMKDMIVTMPPLMAQELSRHKTIQNIRNLDRKNPYILICRDQKYHISVVKIRPPLHISRRENKFIFDF